MKATKDMIEKCTNLECCEKILISKIKKDHLIGEIVLSLDEIEMLGNLIKSHLSYKIHSDINYLKKNVPASLSFFLVWDGIYYYEGHDGNYWSSVENSIGNLNPNSKTKLGEIFYNFIEQNDLPYFEIKGSNKYVTNILLHGMIPDSCLEEYFEHIYKLYIKQFSIGAFEEIVFFLQTQREYENENIANHENDAKKPYFSYTSKPIKRFMLYGGTLSEKFLHQSIQMMEIMDEYIDNEKLDEIELPERIINKFISWWDSYKKEINKKTTRIGWKKHSSSPVILFDYKDYATVEFPAQDLVINDDIEKIQLLINARSSNFQEEKLEPYYKNERIATDEIKVAIKFPSNEYIIQLMNGNRILKDWTYEHNITTDCPLMAFDYESKKLIQDHELPKDYVLIIVNKNYTIKPDNIIIEEGSLYGNWGKFVYKTMDLRNTDKLWLECPDGNKIYVPISEKQIKNPTLIGGKILKYSDADKQSIYIGEPPSIRLNLENINDINKWNLYINPVRNNCTLSEPHYFRLRSLVEILHIDEGSLICDIPLCDEKLLGQSPAGEFIIRLNNDVENIDQWFNLCILQNLSIKFDKEIYFPQKGNELKIYMEIQSIDKIKFESKSPAVILDEKEGYYNISTDYPEEFVDGIIEYPIFNDNSISLPMRIQIPKLVWRIEGLKDGDYSDSSEIMGIPEDVLDNKNDNSILLTVTMPKFIEKQSRLAINGSAQFIDSNIKEGISKFDLLHFSDTIKASDNSSIIFKLDVPNSKPIIENVPLFEIQKWKVTKIKCDVEKKDELRIFNISWNDERCGDNKAIIIWFLGGSGIINLAEKSIDGNENTTIIQVDNKKISPGRYLIHFVKKDPWEQLVFPGENVPNTKEILVDIDNDAPLTIANEKFDEGNYLEAILTLKRDYQKIPFLRNAWMHKIIHGLIFAQKYGEAIDIFKYFVVKDHDFDDIQCFNFLNLILDVLNQNVGYLKPKDGIGMLYSLVCILDKKYRSSSMVIIKKNIDSNIFDIIKQSYPAEGDSLENILKGNNIKIDSNIDAALKILESIQGV